MTWQEKKDAIEKAADSFPIEFGLRAFPGDVFSISKSASYMSEDVIYLYTVVKRGDSWLSFAKGTVSELRREIVSLPSSR
jgi:hypothetical protein